MRRTRTGVAAIVILCLGAALLPAAPALADAERARVHFERAEVLYAQGEFEDALDEYLAAFGEEPLPELLFNVGQCQRNLERHSEAIFSFRRYLGLKPDAYNRDAVLKLIAELERKRARAAAPPPAPEERLELAPAPAPRRAGRPFYKKWWFVTGVLVAGAAVTGAVLLSNDGGGGGIDDGGGTGPGVLPPSTDFGNVELPR